MWGRVDLVWTDASEERIISIFRVEKSAKEEPAWAGGCSHFAPEIVTHNKTDALLTIKKLKENLE
jgi:hypothetical protein